MAAVVVQVVTLLAQVAQAAVELVHQIAPMEQMAQQTPAVVAVVQRKIPIRIFVQAELVEAELLLSLIQILIQL
jgi:hypothetical protein